MARSTKTATTKAKETEQQEAAPVEETEAVQAEETEPANEEPAPVPESKKAEEQESIMYVGPTIPGFGIQNRVSLGIPEDIQDTVSKYPILKNLFIRIMDYPKAAKQIREEKGYIYSAYAKALELKQKGEI